MEEEGGIEFTGDLIKLKGIIGDYSIQVATCVTDKCVRSFVRNLRAKGFKPFKYKGPIFLGAQSQSNEFQERGDVIMIFEFKT